MLCLFLHNKNWGKRVKLRPIFMIKRISWFYLNNILVHKLITSCLDNDLILEHSPGFVHVHRTKCEDTDVNNLKKNSFAKWPTQCTICKTVQGNITKWIPQCLHHHFYLYLKMELKSRQYSTISSPNEVN